MITKLNFIDFLINRASGGDTPKDVSKMYGRGTCAKILNLGMGRIVRENRPAAQQMSIRYTYTHTSDSSGYYVTLNPLPISATESIFSVKDSKKKYNIQDLLMAETVETLQGHNKNGAIWDSGTLRFNVEPQGSVIVTMVPNIYQMEDNAILLPYDVNLDELDFTKKCLEILKMPDFQDELNNNAVDAQQNAG